MEFMNLVSAVQIMNITCIEDINLSLKWKDLSPLDQIQYQLAFDEKPLTQRNSVKSSMSSEGFKSRKTSSNYNYDIES